MSEIELNAVARTEFGKGVSRRLRRDGMVPAVLYGHGTDPVHVALSAHQTGMALKSDSNALLSIKLGSKNTLVLPKDIQRNPVKNSIEHLDLVIVKRGEKVTVEVPIHTQGDPVSGNLVTLELNDLEIQAPATNIPANIVVDVEGLDTGTQITAGELTLPDDVTLITEPDILVVNITVPQMETATTAVTEETADDQAPEAEGAEDSAEKDAN